jgi:hypothetical protein
VSLNKPALGLLNTKQVLKAISVSRPTLMNYIRLGIFPPPIKLPRLSDSESVTALRSRDNGSFGYFFFWRVRDIERWLELVGSGVYLVDINWPDVAEKMRLEDEAAAGAGGSVHDQRV